MQPLRFIGVTLTLVACAVVVFGYARIALTAPAAPSSSSPSLQTGGKVVTRLALPKPVALTGPSTTIQFHLTPQASTTITQAVEAKTTRLLLNVVGINYRQ